MAGLDPAIQAKTIDFINNVGLPGQARPSLKAPSLLAERLQFGDALGRVPIRRADQSRNLLALFIQHGGEGQPRRLQAEGSPPRLRRYKASGAKCLGARRTQPAPRGRPGPRSAQPRQNRRRRAWPQACPVKAFPSCKARTTSPKGSTEQPARATPTSAGSVLRHPEKARSAMAPARPDARVFASWSSELGRSSGCSCPSRRRAGEHAPTPADTASTPTASHFTAPRKRAAAGSSADFLPRSISRTCQPRLCRVKPALGRQELEASP